MTGFVVLLVLVATVVLVLQLTHRRTRDLPTVLPTVRPGTDLRDDADHRRTRAELRSAPSGVLARDGHFAGPEASVSRKNADWTTAA